MVEIYHSIFDTGNCKASILDTVNFAAESKVVLQLISNTVQCTVTSTNITYFNVDIFRHKNELKITKLWRQVHYNNCISLF